MSIVFKGGYVCKALIADVEVTTPQYGLTDIKLTVYPQLPEQ